MTGTERNRLVALLGILAATIALWRREQRRRAARLEQDARTTTQTELPDMGDDPTIIDVSDRRVRRMPEGLTVSAKGVDFIRRHEGLRLQLYNDAVGHATIGYGHLVHRGPINGTEPAGLRDGITEAEAVDLLRQDLVNVTRDLRRHVKVPINQDEFDALASWVFNLGAGNLASSTLLRKLNAQDYEGAAAQFAVWNKARNAQGVLVPLAGLTTRRGEEAALWRGQAVG